MADPITLLGILGASAMLSVPTTRLKPIANSATPNNVVLLHTPTAMQLLVGRAPDTASPLLATQQSLDSQRERTLGVLRSLLGGACGQSATEALEFLAAVPQFMPAPKAAESDEGMVTLFWDTPSFYADVEFRGDRHFSVFTRNRETRSDEVLDNHPMERAGGEWLQEYLEPLLYRTDDARAA